ncbi:MAG: glycosyltransferase family 4 protein [Candidatus Eremiobacteraeota bacterium]|nr:glycosyltransferase family 4 protein [Candidatus Eremiobacteraeota bacterium]
MRIAISNWRDLSHPKAGGAEVATDQLASALSTRGHHVTLLTSSHPGAPAAEDKNGYRIVRKGTELTCRFHALIWLAQNRDGVDIAVDEVNTLPFLSRLVLGKNVVVWMHQLAREVWLAEAPPVIGHIGYALEFVMLSVYRRTNIVTISDSSAESFRRFGLRGTITVAEIELRPAREHPSLPKLGRIGYVGRLAPSKRVDHIVRAFSIVRMVVPHAELAIVGTGSKKELRRLKRLSGALGVADAVHFFGRIPIAERDELVQTFDVLVMASFREGWGLVVSEAARFGVPSVVYPVPGLIDSVRDGRTGVVTADQTPRALAESILRLISDRPLRETLSRGAMQYLARFDEDRFVGRFERVLQTLNGSH